MVDKEIEQEQDPYVGKIRSYDLIVDDDANFEYHLNQDEYLRMIERNKKSELERRKWRKEHERYGKFNPTNYNLDGNLEGTLNFIYWRCDCCQDGFQRVRPVSHEDDLYVHDGQNVMIKGDNKEDTQPRKVPLCNRCITLYHTKGWLVTREKRNE